MKEKWRQKRKERNIQYRDGLNTMGEVLKSTSIKTKDKNMSVIASKIINYANIGKSKNSNKEIDIER